MSLQPQTKKSIKSLAGKVSLISMLAAGTLISPGNAFAIDAGELPTNGTVVGGDASFDYSQPNKLDVHQNTDRTVINWDSFNIGKDATTQFYQPNSNSLAVNRVYSKGVDPTQILGKLIANGKVMVLDRNGVIFGRDSVVDVGGIIASTGDINVDQVMSGSNKIDISNISDAAVINNGLINVQEAGLAGLVAKTAVNNGVIKAKIGRVTLASGEKATVDLYGDNLIEIAADSNLETALVSNSGKILAEGGTVQLTASAAKNAVDNVVNMDGIIDVSSVEVKGGKIILGGGNSTVKVSGKLKADGKSGGGKIDVKGKDITVTEDAQISANAVTSGNGGKIDLIADNIMDFSGLITARGGALSGNGGEVEVSGYEGLNYAGLADLTAANGAMGSLLLDPRFMVIYGGVIPASSTYSISAARLAQQIRTADVIIQADQYIDVGTKDGVYNENVGGFLTNLATNAALNLLPDGDVDLSTFLVAQSSFPFFATGTTAGNLTLKSATVNFNKNLTVGNGNLTVDAGTVNLGSKIYASNGTTLLGDSRLIGTSAVNTINVNSNGKINQAVGFADDATALTTINVAAGTYAESVNVNKANVALKGNGVLNGTRITPNSPGVQITANDVTVDGLTIVNASGATDGYGIIVDGYNNATISNNFVIGSQLDGIKVKSSNSTKVTGNTVNGAGRDGILVENSAGAVVDTNIVSNISSLVSNVGSGIQLLNSNGASVTGNTVSNTSWDGIRLSGASNALVQGNAVNETGTEGIYSQWGGNVTIDDNIVAGTGRNGILIINTGANNQITNNTVNDTTQDGIRVQSSNGVKVTGNDVGLGAGTIGRDGIRLTGTSNGLVDDNDVAKANRYGIFVSVGGSTVNNNTVSNNTVDTTGSNGIYLNGSNNSFVTGNDVGTLGATNNIKGDGILVENSSGATVNNNTVEETHGVSPNVGSGIQILSSNGASVTGNTVSNASWDGIRLSGASDALVQDNNIDEVGTEGIYSQWGGNVTIDDNIVAGTGRNGILIINTGANNQITNNTVNDTTQDGIRVQSSNGVKVTGNDVGLGAGTIGRDGIRLTGTSNGLVDDNDVAKANRYGIFVSVGGSTVNNNTVSNNTVDTTGNHGIYLNGSNNSFVTNNDVGTLGATDNIKGDGILIESSNGVTVNDNTIDEASSASANVGSGIQILNSNGASVTGNTVSNTSWDGIRLSSASDALVQDNAVNETGAEGIYSQFGGNVTINDNTVAGTGRNGILVLNTGANNVVTNNTVNDTNEDGVRIQVSNGATVTGNIIGTGVGTIGRDGIRLAGTSNAFVDSNIVANTVRHGIFASQGAGLVTGNIITNNTLNAIGDAGVYLNGSSNTLVQANFLGLGPDLLAGTADDTAIGGDGIRVANSILADIVDNLIANATRAGIYVSDMGAGQVNISGNEVTNSDIGMNFESGLINLTGASNTITGGRVGYHFEPTGLNSVNLLGNTIGSTIFAGQSQYYVELANGALYNPGTPTIISAIDTSFDGFVPNSVLGLNLTQAQYDQIENGIYHFNDDDTLGLFFFGFSPSIDQSDLFRDIAGIPGVAGRFSITIRGLPRIAGLTVPAAANADAGFSLNDITPAAGGDETDGTNNATGNSLDQITPEAGANENIVEAANWDAAIDAASQGQVVNYSFSGDGSDIMSSGL